MTITITHNYNRHCWYFLFFFVVEAVVVVALAKKKDYISRNNNFFGVKTLYLDITKLFLERRLDLDDKKTLSYKQTLDEKDIAKRFGAKSVVVLAQQPEDGCLDRLLSGWELEGF